MANRRSSIKRSGSKNSTRTLGNADANLKRSAKKYEKAEWVGSIPDGESVVLRIVDTGPDFIDGFVHQVPMVGYKGKAYNKDIWCLDQDDDGTACPGCADDHPRRYKFWCRAIVRDCEKKNASGKSIGYEDKVKIFSSGSKRLLKALNKANKKYDLALHDIEVEREGEEYDTDYDVTVLDPEEPEPLTKKDKALIENSKINLSRYTTPPEFDEFYGKNDEEDDDIGEQSQRRGSAFGSRKKIKSVVEEDDDEDIDDDDDEDESPRPKSKKAAGLGAVKSSKRRRK